ncbi:MAG: hypothetical protein GX465_14560 [Acidobacteria bacterium]|nr:hypothetical protein [Acidobacteriota bacterium]
MDTTFNLLEFIDEQAAQIEALKKEADCSDIVQALEDAGIPMGDGEQCQDIITAIEILGSRIESLKEKLVEEVAWSHFNEERLGARQDVSFSDVAEEHRRKARQQLKAEMPEVGWE